MVVRRGQRAPLHLQAVVRIACEAAAQAGTVFAGVHAATARNARAWWDRWVCVVWAPQRQPSALQPRSRSRVHEPAHSLLPALASLRVARDREMYGYSKSQCIKS